MANNTSRPDGRKTVSRTIAGLGVILAFFCALTLQAQTVAGKPGIASGQAIVDFSALAEKGEKVTPKVKTDLPLGKRPRGRTAPKPSANFLSPQMFAPPVTPPPPAPAAPEPSPGAPQTPVASAGFVGLLDNGLEGTFNPDAHGAVGPNHLMIAANTDIRIQNRTGGILQTVPMDTFWTSIGASNVFDPRLLYDPYGQRFIMSAQADPGGANPLVLLGVSRTSDPTGLWNLYKVDVDEDGPRFADSPNLGFNSRWIVIQSDLFNSIDFLFESSSMFVFDKANVYAGGAGTRWDLQAPLDDVASHVPAATYDPTETTLYLQAVYIGDDVGVGYLRTYTITQGLSGPEFTPGEFHEGDAWEENLPDFSDTLPQQGSTRRIYAGDDSRLAHVVYRDGTLYSTHTIFLPVGNPTRAAVQWWECTPNGLIPLQRGRIDDSSGSVQFAYPSIAVNRNLDMVIGLNRFNLNRFAGGWYAFRALGDVFDTLRPVTLMKDGEAFYYKTNDFGNNAWGDWNSACVDPLNDTEMWTLLQYASAQVGGQSRWGTWWGRISPPADLEVTMTDSPDPVTAGNNISYSITVSNNWEAIVEGVVLTNTFPAGMSFVSAVPSQGSCAPSGNQVICNLGRLNELARATITIIGTPFGSGQFTNVARVASRGPDEVPSDNVASTVTTVNPSADVAVSISGAPNPVHVGNNLTTTVTVTNRGPSGASGVIVTNPLPPGVIFVSASTGAGTWVRTNGNIIWTIGNMALNASPTLAIVTTATAPGNITNRSFLRVTSPDPQPANNTAVGVVRANALPTISAVANTSTAEDSPTTVNFTVSDAETAAAALVITASSSNQGLVPNANLTPGGSGANRSVTITPAANQFGSAVITCTVTDADGGPASTTFTLTVVSVNDPPTLNAIANTSTLEDSGVRTVSLTGITMGPSNEGQTPVATAISSAPAIVPNPTVGAVVGGNATLSYTPAANAFGSATITVTVNDGGASNNTVVRTFAISVTPVNDAPSMNNVNSMTIPEDAPQQTVTLAAITAGANETDSLTITASQTNPSLLPNLAVSYVSGASGSVTFTPAANTSGSSVVTLTMNDGQGSNNVATRAFTVTVVSVNDPPSMDPVADISVLEDAPQQTINLSGIGSGAANESQTVAASVTTSTPALITGLALNYTSPNTAGTITFTPAANGNGAATISVTLNDGGASNNVTVRTINVNVLSVNDAPTLNPIADVTVEEDSAQTRITLTGIDNGPANEAAQTMVFTAVSSNPAIVPHPIVNYTNGQPTAALRFTPAPNGSGPVLITVTGTDSGGTANGGVDSIVRTFAVTVNPSPDPPTITALGDQTIPEDGVANYAFQVQDAETPVSGLTISITASDPALFPQSSFVLGGSGTSRTLHVTPAANDFGRSTNRITITDGDGMSVSEDFVITVFAVNDPPGMTDLAPLQINEDSGQQTVLLSGLTGGPADEAQNLTVTATSSNPSVIPTPTINYTNGQTTGVLRFTPAPNGSGVITLTVRVNDGGASNNITLKDLVVTINDLNDAPSVSAVPNQFTAEDVMVTIPITIGDVETPVNALVLSAESFNEELLFSTDITFGGSGANRTVNLYPLPEQSGSAFIILGVTDGGGLTTVVQFELVVTAVNDPPGISVIATQTMNQATSRTVTFAVGDVETIETALTVSASSSNPTLIPSAGLVLGRSGPNRTLTITPAANQFGTAMVNVTASDGQTNSTRSFTVIVNDLPTISTVPNQTISEDGVTAALPVQVGDTRTAAGALVLTASSTDLNLLPPASFTFGGSGANRTVTIRPVADRSGSAIVTLSVADNEGGTASTILTVAVNSVDDPPIIASVAGSSTLEDTPGSITFTVSDPETGSASVAVAASSSNESIIPESGLQVSGAGQNRTVTVTPALNANGNVTITLVAFDPGGTAVTQAVAFAVTAVNDDPLLSAPGTLVLSEDVSSGPIAIGVNDVETSAAALVLTASSSNPGLLGGITLGGSGVARTVSILPGTNQSGSGTVTLQLSDGTTTITRNISVTVNAVNDPPTLNAPADITIAENAGLQTVNLSGISAGPANESGQAVSITASSSNPALIASVSVNYVNPNAAGTLTFTPLANQDGTAVITVTANDGQAQNGTVQRTFLVTVNPGNTAAPTISAIANRTTLEDTAITASFTIGDSDTPLMNLSVTGISSNLTLVANSNIIVHGNGASRTVTITPSPNQTGSAIISLTVSDGTLTARTTFTLTVAPVNDPPTIAQATNVFLTGNPGTVTVPLTGIGSGGPGESDTLSLSVTRDNATMIPGAPTVTYTNPSSTATLTLPFAANPRGNVNLTVTVNDNRGSNNITTMTFSVSVRSTINNTAPYITPVANRSTAEDTPITVPFNVRDAQSTPDTLILRAVSSNPALIPPANMVLGGSGTNRTIALTPAPNASGSAVITLTALDTSGGGTNNSFTLTVTPNNDPPLISVIGPLTLNEDATSSPISFNVEDVETPSSALTLSAINDNATLLPAGAITFGGDGTNRAFVVKPAANQSGSANVTIRVGDGTVMATRVFVLTVNAVADDPTISAIPDQTVEGSAVIAFTVGDAESPATALVVTATSANQTLLPNANLVTGGSGANRTVTVTPAAGRSGSSVVTVTVQDQTARTALETFVVTVPAVNAAPTLNPLADVIFTRATATTNVTATGISSGASNETQHLVITATSSNPALVPHPQVVYTSPNATATLIISANGQSGGSAVITVTVYDGQGTGGATTRTFNVTVNAAPTLRLPPTTVILEDGSSPALPFNIGDTETLPANLLVTVTSHNLQVVNGNWVLGGSGTNRTLTLMGLPNQYGAAEIEISVRDQQGAITADRFLLVVAGVNDAPTFNPIANQSLIINASPQTVSISAINSGAANEAQGMSLLATSSNPGLIPHPSVSYSSPGSAGSLGFTPVPNQTGSAIITVRLTDDGGIANGGTNFSIRSFTVNVASSVAAVVRLTYSSGNARISWPVGAGDYVLQASDNLNASWGDVGTPPTIVGDENVIVQPAVQSRFYRLRRR